MVVTRVHATVLAGLAVLAAAAVIVFPVGPAVEPPAKATVPAKTARPPAVPTRRPTPPPPLAEGPALPQPVVSPHPPGSPENQDWVQTRISAMEDLAWFDDSASMVKILAELRNPLPEIRTAALAATKAFGSRDAIPYLETIAAESRDPAEQAAVAAVIAHLNLPSMIEQFEGDAPE